ncbi:hypothetical protein BVC80_9063g95 [Macleaya cordata]|uniref:Thionin-like protein 2 n=1 Tax=Macleaya cordata TaxID=56857 RepID=A0A200PNE4_MACCD|nr:hypothetical protein BVC80_9063g95 [Macleaya cordata]
MMLIVTVLVLGLFVEQTEASFMGCYAKCFLICSVQPFEPIPQCALGCFKQCHHPSSSIDDLHYYCQMGCAASDCTNISTPQHPRAHEVEGCLNSCSDKCTLKH